MAKIRKLYQYKKFQVATEVACWRRHQQGNRIDLINYKVMWLSLIAGRVDQVLKQYKSGYIEQVYN